MNATAIQGIKLEPLPRYSDDIFDNVYIYDRRYLPRWEIRGRVFYQDPVHHLIVRTQMKNLTPSGACLYADKSIEVNQRMELKIHLSPNKDFRAVGTVMWKRFYNRQTLIGILFDELEDSTKKLILEHSFMLSSLV
ncbi:MAG: PilZ domain-containing protein [Candidatus Omnitrophica bacterium]|nr:PilZ domain-containing protein [Candidatus Omnitrophota bacterium]